MSTLVVKANPTHSPSAFEPDPQRDEMSRTAILNRGCTSVQFIIDTLKDSLPAYSALLGKDWERLSVSAIHVASGISWLEASSEAISGGRFNLLQFAVAGAGTAAKRSEKQLAEEAALELTPAGEQLRERLIASAALVQLCTQHLLSIMKASAGAPDDVPMYVQALEDTRGNATVELLQICAWLDEKHPQSSLLSKKPA